MTGFLAALIEAWSEFRVHRARVLLSLLGVAVAVCAITAVTGLGNIATQAQIEQMERGSGRPATFALYPPYNPENGQSPSAEKFAEATALIIERYRIEYHGTVLNTETSVQFPDGVLAIPTIAVDVAYGAMHRISLAEGRWFTDNDGERLAPVIVVNDAFWKRLGSPDLAMNPTVTLGGASPTTAVIIGVQPPQYVGEMESFLILNSAHTALASTPPGWAPQPQVELWVPPEMADELQWRIQADLASSFGEGWDASGSVQRNDYLGWGDSDPLGPLRAILSGIAILVLVLGALSLVNISLVTVRQRLREIGIRRAFGATAGRVFLAVMLESVVATVVAGIVGVIAAILIVRSPWVLENLAPGLTDVPAFPVEAAVIGLVSATAVGALAGLVPALVATRMKVIEAIRA